MDYKKIKGHVACRYAFTPPVINCDLARRYGVEINSEVDLEADSNVKLRIVLADGTKRMTCHAKIDWVKKDPDGEFKVGIGSLSLTDHEFETLIEHVDDRTDRTLEFGDTVRETASHASPVLVDDDDRDIYRVKAVELPVRLIDKIDESRDGVSFSEFVARAIEEYANR